MSASRGGRGGGGGGGGGLPPRPTLDPGNILLSPRTRRRQRGRETHVLDNVTTASTLTNPPAITPELLSTINALIPAGASSAGFRMNPSPDEMVIRQRGRREVPLTFSPDVLTPQRMQRQRHQAFAKNGGAGGGGGGGMTRLLLPTRSSPRKRLTLGDDSNSFAISSTSTPTKSDSSFSPDLSSSSSSSVLHTPSPDKTKRQSPISKKLRVELCRDVVSPLVAIKGLSHAQLLELMGKLIEEQPSLEDKIGELMPQPDLSPMEEKLAYLKRNVFKTLPNTRLGSRTDSLAYNRASTHLLALKKAVVDQGKQLMAAQQWASVVDHTVMAWGHVKATPIWDNPPHNNVRKQCLKALAANCMQALKQGEWNVDSAKRIQSRSALGLCTCSSATGT